MLDTLANGLALLGMLALAWPAVAADRMAGRIARIDRAARHPDTDSFFKELREEALRAEPASIWRPLHRCLLYGGYAALLGAAVLRMFG